MMATRNGDKGRKRSVATYGKARRRPGPGYLAPSKAFQDDLESDRRRYSDPWDDATTVDSSTHVHRAQTSPSPVSDGSSIFDFRLSDSEDAPSHLEKRKRNMKQPKVPLKRSKIERSRVHATATGALSNNRPRPPTHNHSVISTHSISTSSTMRYGNRQPHGKDILNPMNQAPLPHTDPGITPGAPNHAGANSDNTIVSSQPPVTTAVRQDKELGRQNLTYSSTYNHTVSIAPPQNIPQPISPEPRSLTSYNPNFSRTTTPNKDHADNTLYSSGQSTPTALTPKSVKMWNGLLGSDLETVLSESEDIVNKHTTASRCLPRRRLIDSFVEKIASEPASNTQGDGLSLKECILEAPPNIKAEAAPDKNGNLAGPATIAISHVSGPRVTYSRQRSMLAEQDILHNIGPSSSQIHNETLEQRRRRRGSIPTLSRFHSLDENMEGEDRQPGAGIQTFHELRQAGANKRFVDEVEDLSERIGMPSRSPSMRRSGLLDLLGRSHDKAFLKSLITNGMDQRLFLHLSDEHDIISGFIIGSILIILLNSAPSSVLTSHLLNRGFLDFLGRLIKVDGTIISIAGQRKTNMPKATQALLAQEYTRLLEMQIWGEVQPTRLTPRLVGLACLDLVIRHSRESGNAGGIISQEITEDLFSIVNVYVEENSWQPVGQLQVADLHLTIAILELCSPGLSNSSVETQWADQHLAIIREITRVVLKAGPSEFSSSRALVLSLTLNTTNSNSHASAILATAAFIREAFSAIVADFKLLSDLPLEEKRSKPVDSLILTLGIMINLVEWGDRANQQTRVLDNSCLKDAVEIFMTNLEKASEVDSVEEANLNVTFGYLAVLLGYLSLSKDVALRIRRELPGHNLGPLISAVDEFIDHYRKVDTQSEDGAVVSSLQSTLTERLSRMLARLRIIERDSY